jgi:hypothetical protein
MTELHFVDRRAPRLMLQWEIHLLVDDRAYYGLTVRAADANTAVEQAWGQVPPEEQARRNDVHWSVLGCVKLQREDALAEITTPGVQVYGHQ